MVDGEKGSRLLSGIWGKVLDGLFPQICVYCEGETEGRGGFLCGLCRQDIKLIQSPYCCCCGAPAEISYDYPHDDFVCGLCRKKPYYFDRARSLGWYDGILKKLIYHFKYAGQTGVMTEIAPLLRVYFAGASSEWEGFEVVPVPLHPKRLREREFDQSYLLASQVARTLNLPLADSLLKRVKETRAQAKMMRSERIKNMVGAFRPALQNQQQGSKLLLVDDVFTTGATVNEAARVLKKAGASLVYVFTLARA